MKLPFPFRNKDSDSESSDWREKSRQAGMPGKMRACVEVSEDEPILGLSNIYFPDEQSFSYVRDIADALLDMGRITGEQREQIRHQCERMGNKPGSDAETVLVKSGFINAEDPDLWRAKAELYSMEYRDVQPEQVQREAFDKLDIDFIRNNNVMPVSIEVETGVGDNSQAMQEATVVLATSEPANIFAIEDAKQRLKMNVRVLVCRPSNIEAVCDSFREEVVEYCVDDILSDMTDVEVVQDQPREIAEDLEKMAGQSPVIKFVNYLISNAISEGASDIHIEPKNKYTRIRYRIDGVLFENMQSPLKMHSAVVSRIKIMSNLDISERRLPQDGKVSVIIGKRAIDLRVSILPTNNGEKVVIRILDSKSILRGLGRMGMDPAVMNTFKEQIALPHGIMLVTGPTGSGKSTTLYSALAQMDGERLNISTVEDPVEYELGFCNQVQVIEKIGLGFATALRSLLRQDPDIIMIGEIRDKETAQIAVQAALTGHLVLSTLHTNDAASSVTRLVNIGIDPYLIAASLNSVLAQRLVRKICTKCKEPYQVPPNMKNYVEKAGVKPEQLSHGAGCEHCRGSGYSGRIGIYEMLLVDDRFRDMINKDSSLNNMRRAFMESGQSTLFGDGIKKVEQGLTTLEEVLRVTEVHETSTSAGKNKPKKPRKKRNTRKKQDTSATNSRESENGEKTEKTDQ